MARAPTCSTLGAMCAASRAWLLASCFLWSTSMGCAPVPERPAAPVLAVDGNARARSDAASELVTALVGRFEPETMSGYGLESYDAAIADLEPDRLARWRAACEPVERELRERLRAELDADVAADLEALLWFVRLRTDREQTDQEVAAPVDDPAAIALSGLEPLFGPEAAPARRARGGERLRAYLGGDDGKGLVAAAERRARAAMARPGTTAPSRAAVERVIANTPVMVEALTRLVARQGSPELSRSMDRLGAALSGYAAFLRDELLPRARTDPRLPRGAYLLALREAGIDAPPLEIAAQARAEVEQVQRDMSALASRIAERRGLASRDYREVLRALAGSRARRTDAELVSLYRERVDAISAIVRREKLLTLPPRALSVRVASAAEGARLSAPFYVPPRLVGNIGERGELVLPRRTAADGPGDFDSDGASFWLAAHEGRPGHDLQYSSMLAAGVSFARAAFGFNSALAEGWGLYAEGLMRPYLSEEAQLATLQARLMRALHAQLDIELNLGRTTPAEAKRAIVGDAVFSEAWADQCIQRYTFVWPGQAPSYLYGDAQLTRLRAEVQRGQGSAFDQAAFHDFVLAQGFLPFDALRRTTLRHFLR